MKYENGKDIFPADLLRQIQKYVSGKVVYIPAKEKKRAWGETSGYKRYLSDRNRAIRAKFRAGAGMEELAEEYFLSCETIKKIAYSKKEEPYMQYSDTVASAKAYAEADCLEDWVHLYLLSDGNNRDFSEGLKLFPRRYLGPTTMPLSLFERCCGPEETMKWRVHPEWFEQHVTNIANFIRNGGELPPLIVHFFIDEEHPDGAFELNDGNHRFEAFARLGITQYPVIVWITEESEVEVFKAKYPQYAR